MIKLNNLFWYTNFLVIIILKSQMENKVWKEDQGPKVHHIYKAENHQPKPKDTPSAPRVVDLNKSYESMGSNEED